MKAAAEIESPQRREDCNADGKAGSRGVDAG